MLIWEGSAAICINQNKHILMVLQGKAEEAKTWSVPSGGKLMGETFEECCIREVREETGYNVSLLRELETKNTMIESTRVTVKYYLVKLLGGEKIVQDPDELIYDIEWKSMGELNGLELSFPEDREYLRQCLQMYG